jgi:fructokinase
MPSTWSRVLPSGGAEAHRRIAVGGEALVDLVTHPDGRVDTTAGGGPFNSARTIARLGADVSFCGTVSTDPYGQMLARRLTEDGVDLSLTRRSDLPTPLATAVLDDRGNATYRFAFDGTAAPDYPLADRPALTGFAAFHVGTLGLLLEPMVGTYRAMVAEAPDDLLVVCDPNCRPAIIADRDAYLAGLATVLARADVVKVSTDDLVYFDPTNEPAAAAARILDGGARVVLLTAGAGGTTVLTRLGSVHVPTMPVEVVDTIGAGDALGGAFTAWWVLNGHGRAALGDVQLLRRAVEAATVVASITCQRVGAEPPMRTELPADWLG